MAPVGLPEGLGVEGPAVYGALGLAPLSSWLVLS